MKYIFKYIFIYFYVLFFKIIESFKPFIPKCVFYKTNKIIKSLSGLLQNIPYITAKKEINTLNNNNVKQLIGYMEHDPKKEAVKNYIKNYIKKINFWNTFCKIK
jgi:GR25 family glycosyltransferase involved in LPS biosynthesis